MILRFFFIVSGFRVGLSLCSILLLSCRDLLLFVVVGSFLGKPQI